MGSSQPLIGALGLTLDQQLAERRLEPPSAVRAPPHLPGDLAANIAFTIDEVKLGPVVRFQTVPIGTIMIEVDRVLQLELFDEACHSAPILFEFEFGAVNTDHHKILAAEFLFQTAEPRDASDAIDA